VEYSLKQIFETKYAAALIQLTTAKEVKVLISWKVRSYSKLA